MNFSSVKAFSKVGVLLFGRCCDRTWEKGPCRATQIMIFLYRRFSATTPKNQFSGQIFCVRLRGISHSLPTLTLSLRGLKYF